MYRRIISLVSFAVSCILLSISCNEMPVGLEEPMTGDMQEYTITAEVTLPESTRTTMNASFETQWQNSDAVSVFYKQKGKWRNAKFSYSTGKDFKGKLSNPDVNSTWYIQYPYSSSAKSPESSLITVSGNPVQNGYGSNAHLSGSKFPLSGSLTYTGGNNIPSFNLSLDLSIIRFTVTNGESSDIVITGVEFTAPQDIVGGFTGDITASGIGWEPTSFNSNTVSLSVRNGSALAPGATADFYFGIIPLYSVSGEYGLKVYAECAGEDAVSTKQVEHSFTFAPDMINTLTYTFVKDEGPAIVPTVRYELVTSAPDGNWNGQYLVLNTSEDGTAKALDVFAQPVSPEVETTVTGAPVEVEVVDGYVAWNETVAQYAIDVTQVDKNYTTITPNPAYNFQNSYGNYIFASSSKIYLANTNFHTNQSVEYEYYQSFQYDNGVIMRSCRIDGATSDQYYLKYDASGDKFVYDKTSTNRVQVYRLVDDRTAQTLSFQEAGVSWTTGQDEPYQVGSSYAMPQQVSGAQTSVSYSSSVSSVAEIVSGQIKINGTGSTVITATAEGSEAYAPASASYTLTISAAAAPSTERNLGSFNLVNSNIQKYLDKANSTYSEGNWGSSVITSKTGNDGIYYGKDGDLGDYSASGTPNESQKHTLGSGKVPTGYDYPNPVVIDNLSSYNGSNAVVTVYKNSARTEVENTLTLPVSGGEVNVYNLIPGRTYYYTVSISNSEVDRGYFATTGERRFLLVQADANIDSSGKITNPYADHANNCRDFGGLKVGDGSQHLKYNLIFRGSNIDLTKNNAAEKETFLGYMGVRLDVDLRKTAASSGDYRDFAKQIHTSYNSETIDWIGPGISGGSDLISTNSTYKTKVKNILQSIIDHVVAGKPVYIHCFAGADRTGYICCLLEALLGVSEKDCSIDYELTSFSCVCVRDRAFKLKTGAAMQTCYPYIKNYSVSGVSNPTFQQKANQIVRDLGISQADIDAFKSAMIE